MLIGIIRQQDRQVHQGFHRRLLALFVPSRFVLLRQLHLIMSQYRNHNHQQYLLSRVRLTPHLKYHQYHWKHQWLRLAHRHH